MENQEIGDKMNTRDIEDGWRAALYFLATGPSASVQYQHKNVRSHLFALKAQALYGDCPPGQYRSMGMDPSLRIRQNGRNGVQITRQGQRQGRSMRVSLTRS